MNGTAVNLRFAHYAQLKEALFDVAVLPWGATEAHNYHLPYGTDIMESDHLAAASAEVAAKRGARILVLPTVPFGVNTGQLDIPYTINMNPSTQCTLLKDVIGSLERHGIPKLVIFNSHGGNDFKQMIRELQPGTRMFLCTLNWYKALNLNDFFDKPGDHADEMETSVMLHIAPAHVLPLTVAGEGKEHKMLVQGFTEGWAWAPRQWTRATADTGVGDPRLATVEKGRKFFEAVTEKAGSFLAQLAATHNDEMYEK
ncbi:MAG: creatininase family protein [Bacteroidota bacterium]